MKISELTGTALDWAVAKCEFPAVLTQDLEVWVQPMPCDDPEEFKFQPSTDWSQGGPIIEREGISTSKLDETLPDAMAPHPACWSGHIDGVFVRYGSTPLIAAMRCYVMSRFGDEIEIPQELFE